MKTNFLICLVFAVPLLLTANVQAELLHFTTDRTEYLGGVHGSDWKFTSVGNHTGGKGDKPWTQWAFNIENEAGEKSSGTIYSDNFNGNGTSGAGSGTAGVNSNGTGSMSHNSANNFTISFAGQFVNSFFIALEPWSSFSAADAFNLTIQYWDFDGILQTLTLEKTFTDGTPFLGFNLDDGAYLASVEFNSIGTGNNGYNIIGMGLGDNGFDEIYPDIDPPGAGGSGTTSTPEPATLLILSLGAIGAGLATRRRISK